MWSDGSIVRPQGSECKPVILSQTGVRLFICPHHCLPALTTAAVENDADISCIEMADEGTRSATDPSRAIGHAQRDRESDSADSEPCGENSPVCSVGSESSGGEAANRIPCHAPPQASRGSELRIISGNRYYRPANIPAGIRTSYDSVQPSPGCIVAWLWSRDSFYSLSGTQ